MNQEVTEYIQNIKHEWQAEVCNRVRQVVLQALPEVTERIQYGKPHYLKGKKYVCVFGTAKAWVSLTIFNAHDLETPEGLFEASENGDRKTIKIREGQDVDDELLARLIQQAASTL